MEAPEAGSWQGRPSAAAQPLPVLLGREMLYVVARTARIAEALLVWPQPPAAAGQVAAPSPTAAPAEATHGVEQPAQQASAAWPASQQGWQRTWEPLRGPP